jgi:hypothetical protein
MAYKKYIKRDGKLYGPYIYQSKRVDGKVVSEYCGPGKKDYKKFVLPTFGILTFVVLLVLFFSFKGNFTGNVVLNNDAKSASDISSSVLEPVIITLKQGEFIPASSLIVFETPSNKYEYSLSNLVSENTILGNYYIEGESVSGEGEGYGLAGENTNSPKVYFTLISRKQTITETSTTESNSEVNLTSEVTLNDQTITESQPLTSEETSQPITTTEENTGIISQALEVVGNFFLNLGLTGNVIDSNTIEETEIKGEASLNNPFYYNLEEGENIELLSGSVKTDSINLPDKTIMLRFEEGKVIAEVEYVEISTGFGENYLGNKEKVLSFEIPSEIDVSNGYNVKLIYSSSSESQESSTQTNAEVLVPNFEQISEELIEQNVSTNLTLEMEIINTLALTSEEKEFLQSQFGNVSIKTISSKLFNGRYIIEYSYGDYTIEYSYDSSLNGSLLNAQMEKDRIKWLKDIYNSLNEVSPSVQDISFDSNFAI